MSQNYTILFDLDGTIVNTAPDLMAAHNHVMRTFGFEEKKNGGHKISSWQRSLGYDAKITEKTN